jgi:hypothetical protein
MSALTGPANLPASIDAAPREMRPPSTLRCFALLVAVKAGLRVLGFGRTHGIIVRISRGRDSAVEGSQPIVNATAERVVMAAAFFPGRALCLEQSLALYLLLRRMGIQAVLQFGVQTYPFAAHAWVEHAGLPVQERDEFLRRFTPLIAPLEPLS